MGTANGKTLLVRCDLGELWVTDVEALTITELKGEELSAMIRTLITVVPMFSVQNAFLVDDITELEASADHDLYHR